MPIEDVLVGLQELAEAHDDYEEAEAYYEGDNPELFASLKIARALRSFEKRYRLRLAKVPVDSLVDRLEIAAVTVARMTEEDGQSGEDVELSRRLQDDIRDLNDMEMVESLIHEKASMFGDAYLVIDTVDPEVELPEGEEQQREVKCYYNSPYETRIVYDSSGMTKRFAIKAWLDELEDGREVCRVDLYYADGIERWITKPGAKGDVDYDWLPYEDQPVPEDVIEADFEPGWIPKDWGEVPVFHFRNHIPYGRPEHEAAFGPQDMIDKLSITQMATVDFQGFPQRYLLMDPNAEDDGGEDWVDDDADVDTESEPTSKLKAGPGELWRLWGAKNAGQFDVASPAAFLDPISHYARGMSTVTSTPFHTLDKGGQAPTGESRRTEESGQTKKLRKRQKWYGTTWRDAYAFAMKLLTGQDLRKRIDIRWVPAESIDEAEKWDLAGKKKAVGLPTRQILLEAGYTEDQIDKFEELSLAERKRDIELQREAFGSTFQQNRDDRPGRPVDPQSGRPRDGGGQGGGNDQGQGE